jgi:quinol-cytochrome oxidoreductase complex cytochrome b subunit
MAAVVGLLLMLGVIVAAFFLYFWIYGHCSYWAASGDFILVCTS